MNAGARQTIRLLGAAMIVAAGWGCSTQQVTPSPSPSAGGGGADVMGLGPSLTVERFLQAANAREWSTMMRLFGTENGPVDWDRQYGELHMNLLAEVLQHGDFQIGTASAVPGRPTATQTLLVTLEQSNRTVEDVPFTVVQDRNGNWLVEEIDTVKLTGR